MIRSHLSARRLRSCTTTRQSLSNDGAARAASRSKTEAKVAWKRVGRYDRPAGMQPLSHPFGSAIDSGFAGAFADSPILPVPTTDSAAATNQASNSRLPLPGGSTDRISRSEPAEAISEQIQRDSLRPHPAIREWTHRILPASRQAQSPAPAHRASLPVALDPDWARNSHVDANRVAILLSKMGTAATSPCLSTTTTMRGMVQPGGPKSLSLGDGSSQNAGSGPS